LIAAPAAAQELTNPRDMGLPDSAYTRPDPADFQLVLVNGLVAYVARADQVPLVTMSAFVRAGKIDDDQQGSAESLLDALRNSGHEPALKRMTADLTVEMHEEWTEIVLNVPAEDLDQALSIFADMLRTPAISAANIESAAADAAPAPVEASLDAAVDRFYDVIYADHPYGVQPTADDFAQLDAADIAGFHARYFVPGNMTIAVAGDIDVDAVNGQLVDLFSDWSASDIPEPRQLPPTEAAASKLHHIPANKLLSWLVFGNDLPQVPLDEQAALDVMNYILGAEHLTTRLMIATRYKYGLTNDASAFLEDKWFGPGGYSLRSYSRPEFIGTIYEYMMDEVVRIRGEEVSEEELFIAKGALTDGNFQIAYLDGYATTRSFALERLRYGNHDRSASYVQRIRSVSEDDVLNAAREYLRPDEMQVILYAKDTL
jgi:predicted Zn-dependent peptidase